MTLRLMPTLMLATGLVALLLFVAFACEDGPGW